jgi:hypothetical protein
MFGFRFIKVQPTTYLLQHQRGKIVREGAGLAFFYYGPTTSLVAVPMGSADVPFIFEENSADFQALTIQGQLTYRITDPKKAATLLNFTLDPSGRGYVSDDPTKVPLRAVNAVKVLAQQELKTLDLRAATLASDQLVQAIRAKLPAMPEIQALGLEVLGLVVLAIKPTPETARALEAGAREQLLKEADEAIYRRRNSAVEQERAIKENELNTEVAIENKKRQIREAQMDAERAVREKQHALERSDMEARIALEEQNKSLTVLSVENARAQADARAYALQAVMKAFAGADPRVLQALASTGMKPEQLIAAAFQELASRADKIGELNISPDLLSELIQPRKK